MRASSRAQRAVCPTAASPSKICWDRSRTIASLAARRAAVGGSRSRRRRDVVLHVRHDGSAQRRAGHATQHLHQPGVARVRPFARIVAARAAATDTGSQRPSAGQSAVGAVFPRDRLSFDAAAGVARRQQARSDVSLGCRRSAAADRARTDQRHRRRADDDVAVDSASGLPEHGSVERRKHRLWRRRRGAGTGRASEGRVSADCRAGSGLWHDGDVVDRHVEQRHRLRAQTDELRTGGADLRHPRGRRPRPRRGAVVRSASCGSKGRTSSRNI